MKRVVLAFSLLMAAGSAMAMTPSPSHILSKDVRDESPVKKSDLKFQFITQEAFKNFHRNNSENIQKALDLMNRGSISQKKSETVMKVPDFRAAEKILKAEKDKGNRTAGRYLALNIFMEIQYDNKVFEDNHDQQGDKTFHKFVQEKTEKNPAYLENITWSALRGDRDAANELLFFYKAKKDQPKIDLVRQLLNEINEVSLLHSKALDYLHLKNIIGDVDFAVADAEADGEKIRKMEAKKEMALSDAQSKALDKIISTDSSKLSSKLRKEAYEKHVEQKNDLVNELLKDIITTLPTKAPVL